MGWLNHVQRGCVHLRNPFHADPLHREVFDPDKKAVDSRNTEYDTAESVDGADVLSGNGNFEEQAGKDKGQGGCHSA
jgi:hypothetical protein